jgi:glyoxylase-like metal-dependent hydrolase (beta-lactamase superfamily II)
MEDVTHPVVLLTHGHADHAAAAPAVAGALGAEIWGPRGVEGVTRVLGDGDEVETDEGVLTAVHTPGHTLEHLAFHWPRRHALFAGDLLLGRGETTWVAEYPGCVADYLASLERLRGLDLEVIYPAHGPPLEDPLAAIGRFEGHRRERIRQVREAMAANPGAGAEELLDAVYGEAIPPGLEGPALRSLAALVEYVSGQAREGGDSA